MQPSPSKISSHIIPRSQSTHSLYTENSQDSDANIFQSEQPQPSPTLTKQQPISTQIQKLPQLLTNAKETQIMSSKLKIPLISDIIPSLPQKNNFQSTKQRDEYNGRGIKLSQLNGPAFNTIAVASLQGNEIRKIQDIPFRLTGKNGFNHDSDKTRMLRSSQGGRWLRSQSLMQENSIFVKGSKTGEFLGRNYLKDMSKFTDQYENYMNFYNKFEKHLHEKTSIFHTFKISMADSLEEIKNKMQSYLQTKVDLSNLAIERPDADWKQDQLMSFYSNYKQILKQTPSSTLLQQIDDTNMIATVLKKYKNCSYYGTVKDGKKHGFGYLHYYSGRFFEGIFLNDQKIFGFEMNEEEIYLGQYDKNQRNGTGILKNNQFLISGIFTNGEFKVSEESSKIDNAPIHTQRKGFKIQFSNISFYPAGSIKLQKNSTGDIYIGQFNEYDQKQGQGLEIFINGDLYIGRYEQGVPEGYGEYYWDSGAFYRGNFISGMRHGKGVWMMINGDKYEGEYLNDKKNGKGIYTWRTGDQYTGQFENDYRHGYGEMYWNDGASFKGQWLNGIEINKTFKLQKEGEPKTIQSDSKVGKNPIKGAQTRTRILRKQPLNKNLNRNAKSRSQSSNQPSKRVLQINSKKIPLEKLKAILNPSNSIN